MLFRGIILECLFCKIAAGDIEYHKIYEDEFSIAFADVRPSSEGHTIVIPKKHFAKFTDMSPENAASLFSSVNRVAKALEKTFSLPGINIGINNGKTAGQEIPHVHVHLIPRKEGDGGGGMKSIVWTEPPTDNLEEIAKRIRDNFD